MFTSDLARAVETGSIAFAGTLLPVRADARLREWSWALEHVLLDRPLEDLVDAPFDWQPGWRWQAPDHRRGG